MLIGRNNEVLLTDFGIAVVAQSSRLSVERQVAGTVAYMAPEQIQSRPRAASDQYALAVVIYEWLTGERPFQGSFTEVAAKHALTPPPSLREKNPVIPAAVEQVILTALQKDPAKRFPNIRVFADALERASKGILPVSADKDLLPTRLPLSPPPALAMDERVIPAEIAPPPGQSARGSRDQNFYAPVPPLNTPVPLSSAATTESSDRGQSTQQRRRTGFFALGLLILLLAGAFASWLVLSHAGNPFTNGGPTASTGNARTPVTTSPTPSVTLSPSTALTGYPNVTGTYSGSIHNTYANIYSTMTLSISQSQGSISGQFTVARPLQGSGPFNGSIKTDGTLQFLVRSTDTSAPILFTGSRQADGSLSGNYCSVNQNLLCDKNAGGYGVWNVTHS